MATNRSECKATEAQLRATLARQFVDGSRSTVLIVGSGFHNQLASWSGTVTVDSVSNHLSDWSALLGKARFDDKGKEEFDVAVQLDTTATWESIVCARTKKFPTKKASEHEQILLNRLRLAITGAKLDEEAVSAFGERLQTAGFRDVVTLNFDRTLDNALRTQDSVIFRPYARPYRKPEDYRRSVHVKRGKSRIWYAHGVADPKFRADSIQLGLVAYGKSIVALRGEIETFRSIQARYLRSQGLGSGDCWKWDEEMVHKWHSEARSLAPKIHSWVRQMLNSDLVFIGCGLSFAEIDLWMVLHERQRQLARVPECLRPRAFFLHARKKFPKHMNACPAGIVPVRTRTHDDAWRLLGLQP